MTLHKAVKEKWFVDRSLQTGSMNNTSSKNKSIVNGLRYHRRMYKLLESWALFEPEHTLYVEPWFRERISRRCLQPDAVIIHPETNTGIVIEVKLNWKDGRDRKLIDEYLDAAQSAFNLRCTWPALITSNVAGLLHTPRTGLSSLLGCADWQPGDPTPVILVP